MLRHAVLGYRLNGKTVSHLLYLDDLKVFACNPKEMETYKEIIERFRKDICVELFYD